ncbi:hypothetical protein ACKUB1_16840 [Methanospirillum stamsii]|uniref:Uncharacterized protein n=1 Tax=Methanospirillum stamsii TaxID=1277351 RepID=A0A2V2N550_9EURY|nr:hypothetical protein [Methanospirillum stamsii]PWR74949.1 hypothetical protein DLD82_06905 [Methanospirillum stamsii]
MPEDGKTMNGAIMQVLMDPVVIIFVLCTIVAVLGKFFRSWVISCVLLLLSGLLIIIVVVTIGQLAGLEDQIRYLITAQYSFFSSISLSLRDIVLTVIIIFAFQLALALHVTKVDVEFQKRFYWLPRKHCCHYEMEYTLDDLGKKIGRK